MVFQFRIDTHHSRALTRWTTYIPLSLWSPNLYLFLKCYVIFLFDDSRSNFITTVNIFFAVRSDTFICSSLSFCDLFIYITKLWGL